LKSDYIGRDHESKDDTSKQVSTPLSEAETRVDSETPTSGTQTPSHEASTSTVSAPSTSVAIEDETAGQPAVGHAKAKMESIIGKINNLITTDIDAIGEAFILFYIRESPLALASSNLTRS
jgi:hypothetical protein